MTRVETGNRIHNTFPEGYDYKKIKVLAYENLNDASKPYCIGVIKDEDLAAFTVTADIEEVSQESAITLGDVWRPQINKITDPKKVMAILDKQRNLIELTQEEEDAMNPDNATIGINKSTSFTDHLTDAIGATDG